MYLSLSARYLTSIHDIFGLNNYTPVLVLYLAHQDMILFFTSCPEGLDNIVIC